MSLKIEVSELAFPDSAAHAIQYCTNQLIPIVSMSWGSTGIYPQIRDALRTAFETGLLLIAASGNADNAVPNYPAAYKRFVTAVTAVLPDGRPWRDFFITGELGGEGNSIGPHVDLTSPAGSYVVTTGALFGVIPFYWYLDDCQPGAESGFGHTSAAAPTVAAVAGLLHSYANYVLNHPLIGEDLEGILKAAKVDIDQPPASPGRDGYTGAGMVRADLAMGFISPPRRISQRAIGYLGEAGSLAVTDSVQLQTREFLGVPGLTDGVYDSVTVAHLEGVAALNSSFTAPPNFWIRSSGTLGWTDTSVVDRYMDGNDGVLVPGSLTKDEARLRTTVYRIPGFGWFPVEPANARVAYTAIADAADMVGVDGGEPRNDVALEVGGNPARGRITLRAVVPCQSPVRLAVYDIAGREMRRLIDGELPVGRHEVSWEGLGLDGARAGSGIYFCRLEACGQTVDRRVIYLRR